MQIYLVGLFSYILAYFCIARSRGDSPCRTDGNMYHTHGDLTLKMIPYKGYGLTPLEFSELGA